MSCCCSSPSKCGYFVVVSNKCKCGYVNYYESVWASLIAFDQDDPTIYNPTKRYSPRLIHLQSIMTSQVSVNSSTTFPSAYYDPKGGTVINANFDSGNIFAESVDSDCNAAASKRAVYGTDKRCHSQWFYFRSSQIKGRSITYRIVNVGQASYPAGFKITEPARATMGSTGIVYTTQLTTMPRVSFCGITVLQKTRFGLLTFHHLRMSAINNLLQKQQCLSYAR